MAVSRIYCATSVGSGAGNDGDLDTIDGQNLADNDMAIVIDSATNTVAFYRLEASGGSGGTIYIDYVPPISNPGTKEWHLQKLIVDDITIRDDVITIVDDISVGDQLSVGGDTLLTGDLYVDNIYPNTTDGDIVLQGVGAGGVQIYDNTILAAETVITGLWSGLKCGENASYGGYLSVYGLPTGNDPGGYIALHTADDHDATTTHYSVLVYEDDLWIGPSTDTDLLKMTAEKDLYLLDGDLHIQNPSDDLAKIKAGLSGSHYGLFEAFGDDTGGSQGGKLSLYTADDYDGTIANFQIQAYQDDLRIGPDTNTDSLIYYGNSNQWTFTEGSVRIGSYDSVQGSLTLTGSTTDDGGVIVMQNAANYDSTIEQFQIKVYEDDLVIGPSTDTNLLKLTAEKDMYLTDGDIYIRNPSDNVAQFFLGQEGAHKGYLTIYGDDTGASTGGTLALELADDYDTTIARYLVQASEDDLKLGPNNDSDLFKITAEKDVYLTDGDMYIQNPTDGQTALIVGVEDNSKGQIRLRGNATGGAGGGVIYLDTAEDYDTTITEFRIHAYQDQLQMGPDTDQDLFTIDSNKDLYFKDGDLYVRNPSDDVATLDIGQNASHRGQLYIRGDDTGGDNGGSYSLYTADDHDGTINRYIMAVSQDDLYLGPDTDTDALLYDGGTNKWVLSASGGVDLGTVNSATMANTGQISWDDGIPSSDDQLAGDTIEATVDQNTVGVNGCLVLSADGNWDDADNDAATTVGMIALAVDSGTGASKTLLLRGFAKDTGWAWTIGRQIYVDESGTLSQTLPSGGEFVQVAGYATSATSMYFNPSPDYIETV